jgi:hypothetical protein
MRIANELYLRLIVGGFEGVYEFLKFVTKGMDRTQPRIYRYGNICSLQRLQLDDEFAEDL